jgi:hypothetical protein
LEVNIEMSELRKRSVMIATPMYGAACLGSFCKSIADLSILCTQMGIQMQLHFLFNESLITRARNYCVDEFLRARYTTEDGVEHHYTHLMFIDSDIGFNPQDVIALLAMASDESEYDVIGGPYPKKCISWEKIKLAVDKGVADENPEVLANFVGDYVFNPKAGTTTISLSEPCEVSEIGTGFMMIRRSTFEKYDAAFPGQSYKPDHVRTAHFDGSREIMAYFDCIIDPQTKRYLSEDYMFCYNVQKMGGRVWFCPWMQMTHTGVYVFGGSLSALASIGAASTASPEELGKNKVKQQTHGPGKRSKKTK